MIAAEYLGPWQAIGLVVAICIFWAITIWWIGS